MDSLSLLVIDDNEIFRETVEKRLAIGPLGGSLEIAVAGSGAEGLAAMSGRSFDVVLTDLMMPGVGGREVLERVRQDSPGTEVIIISGDGEISSAVACLKQGAYDYLPKPVDFSELELRLRRIMESRSMRAEIDSLRAELEALKSPGWELRLPSEAMATVRRSIDAVKDSDFPVLLLGESGTGKEVIADAIQRSSTRASRAYIKVNCAGLVSNLLESEMFGHEKGAFTGAHAAKPGKFELADGGTLFLDEIGELEFGLQAKLLRVLQDGSYERVGGTVPRRADVRIIAATNKDLQEESRAGRFRVDLFYRLNVIRLVLPPLRDRRADILVLASRFLDAYTRKYGRQPLGFSREAARLLEAYPYPGNVRELENAVARSFTMATGELVGPEDLPEEFRLRREEAPAGEAPADKTPADKTPADKAPPPAGSCPDLNLESYLARHEEKRIREALAAAGDNRSLAAEWLGVSRRKLYDKLERYGIDRRRG